MNNNRAIFTALIRRDCYILSKQIKDFLIDGTISVSTKIIVFCYLFPVMGMSKSLVGPMFIGSIVSLLFNINFAQSLRVVFDLKFNQLIYYHLTLPIDLHWLLAQKILSFTINTICITSPIIMGGIILLNSQLTIAYTNIILFLIIYLLTMFFFATFFLTLAFHCQYDWFMNNLWARRLSPLFLLSCILFPWKLLYNFWPNLAYLFLCNPCTYVAEGFRSSLLGSDQFISYTICIPIIMLTLWIAWKTLVFSVKRRLNPVGVLSA